MSVVKLSDDVFFRQFIPDLTPNTAKQEVRRRLSPDYDPAARFRAMLDTPEVQADPRDLMALRSVVESQEMLHDMATAGQSGPCSGSTRPASNMN